MDGEGHTRGLLGTHSCARTRAVELPLARELPHTVGCGTVGGGDHAHWASAAGRLNSSDRGETQPPRRGSAGRDPDSVVRSPTDKRDTHTSSHTHRLTHYNVRFLSSGISACPLPYTVGTENVS